MNDFCAFAEERKKSYLPGMRIRLIRMVDDPHPVPPGTCGTVDCVDGIGTIHVKWDNGSRLGLTQVDVFVLAEQKEGNKNE